MRWLDGIIDSTQMSLSKLQEINEGQGSLPCCSPWGCKESDTTEQLNNNSRERIHWNSEAKGTVIHPQDIYDQHLQWSNLLPDLTQSKTPTLGKKTESQSLMNLTIIQPPGANHYSFDLYWTGKRFLKWGVWMK